MPTRKISSEDWAEFFDTVSAALRGKLIEIEVDSLDLGAQIEARNLSLYGLTYDKKDDAFIIATEAIEHVIRRPRQIFVADGETGLNSLEIIGADGVAQIVKFAEPLALPPRPGGNAPDR